MIKKHLITCSVIVVLFIVSQLFICSITIKRKAVSTRAAGVNSTSNISRFVKNNNGANFNFADEDIPANNLQVNRKLQHSIWQNSFKYLGSDLLHRKAEEMFPIIEPILKMYGIPEDFKYVPLVESALDGGKSARGARGQWQFMPGTARTYGLRVGKGHDDRMDLLKSTVAACIYLRELHDEFNNWTLTAAAYNLGSVKLERAIKNGDKQRNYFKMHLNAETGSYVYKLIAMKAVISKPADYGYKNNYNWLKPSADLLASL